MEKIGVYVSRVFIDRESLEIRTTQPKFVKFSASVKFIGNSISVISAGTVRAADDHSTSFSQQSESPMVRQNWSYLQHQLEQQVRARTGRRVCNLRIELLPERVVLRGRTASYYVKQLAQQSVREVLPLVGLENSISVEY